MRRDAGDLRRALSRVAAQQGGYFTAAQARASGYSYPAQHYHVRRGDWQRLERGIYRFVEWRPEEHGDLVRWTLWSRGLGVISHESALSLYDLGDVMPAHVHLTVPRNFRSRAPGVVLHRADLAPADVDEHEGFRVTTASRSILDVAATDMEVDRLARVIHESVQRGLVSSAQLRDGAATIGRAGRRLDMALRQEQL